MLEDKIKKTNRTGIIGKTQRARGILVNGGRI